MKKIIAFIILLMIASASIVNAQGFDKKHQDKWEKYRSEKIAFLTSELDLTPEEAQKFWPVYNQLEKERWDAQKMRRQMEEKVREAEESMSNEKITRLTREFAGSWKIEADLMMEFNEKFLDILPPQKVLRLYKAESEFRIHMIRKFRDRRKNGN